VILQEPPISEYVPEMRRNISEDLGIDLEQVSIKATTTDGLGFTGRKEGVAALAVATVFQQEE
jgi:2-C-methyl-D-erythritol 2,4-cyclodiphosphate synthase